LNILLNGDKKMRVLILGIDALEYKRVKEWNLEHLMQEDYGKSIVPISEGFDEPATLVVWPSFIAGKEPAEMGFETPILYRQPLKWALDCIYFPLKHKFGEEETSIQDKTTKKSKFVSTMNLILMKAGFGRYPERKDIKASTLFDNKRIKSIHVNIPVYDEVFTAEGRDSARNGVIRAISDKEFRKEFEKRLKDEFTEGKANVFELIKKDNWDLYMQYFYVLDGIQHIFYKNKLKLMDYYLRFNEFVGKLKSQLPENMMLLIISDHGGENGLHTDYGFFSCNKKLNLNNPKISDFKEIIEKKLSE
jgi:predicted AlkP superfamily phosphohydrolase/phosphomutase